MCRYKNCTEAYSNVNSRRGHEKDCNHKREIQRKFDNVAAGLDPNDTTQPLRKRAAKKPLAVNEMADGRPKETVQHLLTCEGAAEDRKLFHTDELLKKYGWRYYLSLPFYAWITAMFDKFARNSDEIKHIVKMSEEALAGKIAQYSSAARGRPSSNRKTNRATRSNEIDGDDDEALEGEDDIDATRMCEWDEDEGNWVAYDDDGFLDYGESPDDYADPVELSSVDDRLTLVMKQLQMREDADAPSLTEKAETFTQIQLVRRSVMKNSTNTYHLATRKFAPWRSNRQTVGLADEDATVSSISTASNNNSNNNSDLDDDDATAINNLLSNNTDRKSVV